MRLYPPPRRPFGVPLFRRHDCLSGRASSSSLIGKMIRLPPLSQPQRRRRGTRTRHDARRQARAIRAVMDAWTSRPLKSAFIFRTARTTAAPGWVGPPRCSAASSPNPCAARRISKRFRCRCGSAIRIGVPRAAGHSAALLPVARLWEYPPKDSVCAAQQMANSRDWSRAARDTARADRCCAANGHRALGAKGRFGQREPRGSHAQTKPLMDSGHRGIRFAQERTTGYQ